MTRTLLRGGFVVDGTGRPGAHADVLLDCAVIGAVGLNLPVDDALAIEVGGLVVAPGFIDPHTHYDAQATWDRDLTPSSWHGVTTVVMGHCGYSVAPTWPDHRDFVIRTLEAVEGMSREALNEGIRWDFETFGDYLDVLASQPNRLNIGGLVGHTALRLYVMGEAAADRAATPGEVEQMGRVMAEAMAAGALGFSTSRSAVDVGAFGRPVPSRLAEVGEVLAISRAMGESGRGVTQILPGTVGDPDGTLDLVCAIVEASGRPVTFAAVLSGLWGPRGGGAALIERSAALGPGMAVPQIACRPIVQQTSFLDPFFLALFSTAFHDALAVAISQRADVYRSPVWRARFHETAVNLVRLEQALVAESPNHPELVRAGTLAAIAQRRGTSVLDLMVDLSLADDLQTRFEVALANDDEEEVADYLRDDRALVSLSDAGAHQSQICDAVYTTHLLGHWVREREVLSLEQAVWHLTQNPARLFGLTGRGVITPGGAADVVVFDPRTVAAGPLQRVHDLPAGADRLIAPSIGIQHVFVNGTAIRRDGNDVERAHAGRVLRSVPAAASPPWTIRRRRTDLPTAKPKGHERSGRQASRSAPPVPRLASGHGRPASDHIPHSFHGCGERLSGLPALGQHGGCRSTSSGTSSCRPSSCRRSPLICPAHPHPPDDAPSGVPGRARTSPAVHQGCREAGDGCARGRSPCGPRARVNVVHPLGRHHEGDGSAAVGSDAVVELDQDAHQRGRRVARELRRRRGDRRLHVLHRA
jgi:N-acyl-D-amino-acid deacylase